MIQDVYEPLEKYQDEFRERFAQNADLEFDRLVRASGVDEAANIETNRQLREAEDSLQNTTYRRGIWRFWAFLAWILILAGIAAIVWPFIPQDLFSPDFWHDYVEPVKPVWFLVSGGGAATAYLSFVIYLKIVLRNLRTFRAEIARLEQEITHLKQEAWIQMGPLNALYDWDIAPRLFQRTVPRVEFDPFLTQGRLAELHDQFGWDDSFNQGKSVLTAQSGSINGNPFVFGRFLEMFWSETTYHGYKEISWTTIERDSEGRRHTVHHHETLHASVTKPSPAYAEMSCLLYGNDAAPNLTFMHKPTGLAGQTSFLAKQKRKHELKKLKKFAENLDDASQFTLMSNHDFEVLFHADDRNDEIEFRLLFTPLAQAQMVKLLEDTQIGYGDDFTFLKRRKINAIFPNHLKGFQLDTDPRQFHDSDIERARKKFCEKTAEFFKMTYFSLAPLLTIPLYQQIRTHENIYKDVLSQKSCFWEHETIANYCGESKFAHPACVTRSILKTHVAGTTNGVTRLGVTAYGYRTKKHIEYVSKWGGDGKFHNVPVEWLEYLPVEHTTDLFIQEQTPPPVNPENDAPYGAQAKWRTLVNEVSQFATPVEVRRSILAFFRK